MTKRMRVLLTSGAAILALSAVVCVVAVRHSRIEVPEARSYVWPEGLGEKEPLVQLGYDGPYWHVADAIRIHVSDGVPHTSAGEPIPDVTLFVNAELEKNPHAWVVVSASMNEKFGSVMQVIDTCRRSRARGVVLNQFPL